MSQNEQIPSSKHVGPGAGWLVLIVLGSLLRITMISSEALPSVFVGLMQPQNTSVAATPAAPAVSSVAVRGQAEPQPGSTNAAQGVVARLKHTS